MTRTTKYAFSLILAGGVAVAALAANAGPHGGHRGGHHGGFAMIERLDTDGDGAVAVDDIRADRLAALARHDANGDGKLSLEEYETLFAERMRRRMVDSFQRLDDDGDGVITETEAGAPVARMARRLDDNGDGVIDKEEIKQAKMHRRGGKRGHDRHEGREHGERQGDKD